MKIKAALLQSRLKLCRHLILNIPVLMIQRFACKSFLNERRRLENEIVPFERRLELSALIRLVRRVRRRDGENRRESVKVTSREPLITVRQLRR